MGLFKRQHKHREQERYYLFPGQGGRSLRRKQRMMVTWALSVGLVASALLGFLIWWFNARGR